MFVERRRLRIDAKTGDPWNRACKSNVFSGIVAQRSADRIALRALTLSARHDIDDFRVVYVGRPHRLTVCEGGDGDRESAGDEGR